MNSRRPYSLVRLQTRLLSFCYNLNLEAIKPEIAEHVTEWDAELVQIPTDAAARAEDGHVSLIVPRTKGT
jgi:hypothetical protein